ncbi:Hypothetical predicted protein, partial [Pelobates cultripes]
ILREFFAMSCHVELPVTSKRECESDNTKFNTAAPHSHLMRICSLPVLGIWDTGQAATLSKRIRFLLISDIGGGTGI